MFWLIAGEKAKTKTKTEKHGDRQRRTPDPESKGQGNPRTSSVSSLVSSESWWGSLEDWGRGSNGALLCSVLNSICTYTIKHTLTVTTSLEEWQVMMQEDVKTAKSSALKTGVSGYCAKGINEGRGEQSPHLDMEENISWNFFGSGGRLEDR